MSLTGGARLRATCVPTSSLEQLRWFLKCLWWRAGAGRARLPSAEAPGSRTGFPSSVGLAPQGRRLLSPPPALVQSRGGADFWAGLWSLVTDELCAPPAGQSGLVAFCKLGSWWVRLQLFQKAGCWRAVRGRALLTGHLFILWKFLSLTEEDLNKFESLTMGAKKKLKTQLELEK